MNRVTLAVAATAAVLAAGAVVAPASAAPGVPGGPARYCESVYGEMTNPVSGETYFQYVIPVGFSFDGETVVEDFGLASFQACVSTVATAMEDGVVPGTALSKPAYLAQCDLLEDFGVVSYPYSFYGTYPAKNRADCATILKGVHTGQLAPGGPPA